ncbi:MAG: cysteine synthase family protein [Anaerolineales bacterium]|nr:cysteine synthase family protein [Anaerolineales bacterium]
MATIHTLTQHHSSSLLDAVGRTPLLALPRLGAGLPPGVSLYAKAEWFNPSGSVKDRPAAGILRAALESGALRPGVTLLDSTSGNMGIAYATLGASLGIPVRLALPASASPERFAMLGALGAQLERSDALEGSDGAILLAQQIAAHEGAAIYYADQYNNPANWRAHYLGTGPEIWQQTRSQVTHFVAGLGTSGTLMGAGRYLRERNQSVRIIAFQPDGPFHGLEGLKHMPSAIRPGIYDPNFADETLEISTEDAQAMTQRLAREEGLFVGVSSGAAAAAALRVAARLQAGRVVTVFPDGGLKYVSQSLWERA